jgi:amidophosphoribosyltransferase
VHVRITSPPFMNPCYYGIDTPNPAELIASSKNVEEIRQAINADSLYFLSETGLIDSVGDHEDEYNRGLCLACFNKDYPTPVEFENAKATSSCGD